MPRLVSCHKVNSEYVFVIKSDEDRHEQESHLLTFTTFLDEVAKLSKHSSFGFWEALGDIIENKTCIYE